MGQKRCPYTPGTFRALQWAFGRHFMLCKSCKRSKPITMAEYGDRSIKSRLICTNCQREASLVGEDDLREFEGARQSGQSVAL